MEQIPFDDPQDAEIADNVLQHLRYSLQLLASPAQAQLSHFPAGWVVLTDEMVLDFDAWVERISSYWKLSKEPMARRPWFPVDGPLRFPLPHEKNRACWSIMVPPSSRAIFPLRWHAAPACGVEESQPCHSPVF